MTILAKDFNSLPVEYQNVLRLAQDKNKIQINPLQRLKGGRSGAFLYLVRISESNSKNVQHLILKIDQKNKKSRVDELERHNIAISQAPVEFVRNHIANIIFDRIELDGVIVIFYTIAGQSLIQYKSVASFQQQDSLERIFVMTNDVLLNGWNKNLAIDQATHPQDLLTKWLGYRLQPGGNIENFLEEVCRIPSNTQGLLIQGHILPNPLVYARQNEQWGTLRSIDTMIGFQHGDLNIYNILVKTNQNKKELTGYYLIDMALFKSQMPLLYDQRYLEVSYLIRELLRVNFSKWIDFIIRFSEEDIIDSHQIPTEFVGVNAVINAGRNTFNKWIEASYPSLSDDLWGQFWLAAVAAGLNYCNKDIISEKERLAGLIFAAVHLKRFHSLFGVSQPVEVKHIDINKLYNELSIPRTVKELIKDNILHNLPLQPTPFIGREKEIAKAIDLLQHEDVRLLTLTGPGGTGKTRLALQVVKNVSNKITDGIYFVDLAPIRDPDSVIAVIARTVGLKEKSNESLTDDLKRKLQSQKHLLILDNFEQITSAAGIVADLLKDCPQLKLLVTSREALHVRGEHVLAVPSLSMPGADLIRQFIGKLTQFEAIQLFIERASELNPDFEVTIDNTQTIAEICVRLDGLPLAIELAAARINLFSPQDLLMRMDNRLKLLRGGAKDLPVRQQAMGDTIDWSYDLLDSGEQKLFALLSVFPDCTLVILELVAGEIRLLKEKRIDILDCVSSLVNKSLIRRIDQHIGGPRFSMLETIREYAAERLEEDPEFKDEVRLVHASFYADLARKQFTHLTGEGREVALKEIEIEIENLRIAWHYWLARNDLAQLHKLFDCLWLVYDALGWLSATADLTTDLLNVLASAPSTPEHAKQEIMLQTSLARVLMTIKGCTTEVENAYKKALELCEKYGNIPQSFPILRSLASFYVYIVDLEKSAHFGKQILNLAEELNDHAMRVEGHLVLGYSIAFSGNIKEGLKHLEKGISIYNPKISGSYSMRFGNNPGVISHTTSALCLWMCGFPDRAIQLTDDAIALAEKLNHPPSIAYALFHTGLLRLWRREVDIVLEHAQTVLEIARKYDFQIWEAVASCLHGAALSGMEKVDEGIVEIKRGIEMYAESNNPPIFWPMLLLLHAGSYIQAGRSKEGLDIINKALEIIGKDSGHPIISDINRLKGDVILLVSPENIREAESYFQRAIEIARKHETTMYELRASMSLSQLWHRKGDTEKGKKLLTGVYEKFTEGYKTADLIMARDILRKLS